MTFWRFVRRFFVRRDLPDAAQIARAKAARDAERKFYGVDEDGHVRRQTGLSEIMRASQESAKVVHFADRRRRKELDAAVRVPRIH